MRPIQDLRQFYKFSAVSDQNQFQVMPWLEENYLFEKGMSF